MATVPKTRARAPSAPIAAPHDEPISLPSPHDSDECSKSSDEILTRGHPNGMGPGLLSDDVRRHLDLRTHAVIASNPIHSLRSVVDSQLQIFRQEVISELNTWRAEFLSSLGEPLKRPPDDDHYYPNSSPEGKRFKPDPEDDDEEEEEGGAKKSGGWRCLYYEQDSRTWAQCGEKRYKRVSELRRHIKTHTLPHHCAKCGYRTAEERRLTNHKCEDANRKRYPPVTPEDKQKHEQLARMGIKVGQMKVILFGSAEGKRPDSLESGSAPGGDEADNLPFNSGVSGVSPPAIPQNHAYVPNNFNNFQQHIPAHTSPNMPHGFTTTSIPQYLSHMSPITQPPFTFNPSVPIAHSPTTGHAGGYYSAPSEQPVYTAYAPHSPITPDDRMGGVPALSVGTSPGSNQMSPQPQQFFAPGPDSYTRTGTNESLDNFLNSTFPEMNDMNRGQTVSEPEYCVNRRMPDSEIQAMERYLASRSLNPIERQATSFFLQSGARRAGFLVRLRSSRKEVSDKSKKFFRSLSGRNPAPLAPVQETLPAVPSEDAPETSAPETSTPAVTPPTSDEITPPAVESTPAVVSVPAENDSSQSSQQQQSVTSEQPVVEPTSTETASTSTTTEKKITSLWKRLSITKSSGPSNTTTITTTTRSATMATPNTTNTKKGIWSSITSIFVRNQKTPTLVPEPVPGNPTLAAATTSA